MKLLTIRQVAERLAISRNLCYRLVSTGKLRAYRIGGAIRFSEEQIQEYLDSSVMDVYREPRMVPTVKLKHLT
jgi:excisionase family DNA binding protein